MNKYRLFLIPLALLFISNVAPAGDMFWTFQDTEYDANTVGYDTALAMRNGLAWPVIFTEQATAISLFPAPVSGGTGSNWHEIGTGLYNTGGRVRATSSPSGKVLVASDQGGIQASVLPYGWTPFAGVAAAFDSSGTVHKASQVDVPDFPGFPGGGGPIIVDIAMSVHGDVGVVDSQMQYYQYIPWTNSWSDPADLSVLGPQLAQKSMDLEFDSLGRPHIVGADSASSPGSDVLYAFDYDAATGWGLQYLATKTAGGLGSNLALAAASDKLMGTAWVNNNTLYYAYKDDLDPWAVGSVLIGSNSDQGSVGIAYDYSDLPVLSFVRDNGNGNDTI